MPQGAQYAKKKDAGNPLVKEVRAFLDRQEFLNIGTAAGDGTPNVAPKFYLKHAGNTLYLIDYVRGKTARFIRENRRVSISGIDLKTLTGYQINGEARLLEKGKEYRECVAEYRAKQIKLSVARIADNVKSQDATGDVEVTLSDNVIVIRVDVAEVVKIFPSGELRKRIR